jgi:hypothetical protein
LASLLFLVFPSSDDSFSSLFLALEKFECSDGPDFSFSSFFKRLSRFFP